MNGVGISLTGLQAASAQLANSANNVANANTSAVVVNGELQSAAYQPQTLLRTSIQPTGGVRTELRPRDPATIPVFSPESGIADEYGVVEMPNVDLAEEAVSQKMATYDYEANLKALEVTDKIMKSLIDILA
jgi:flagellar basal-body rod protein FlgC